MASGPASPVGRGRQGSRTPEPPSPGSSSSQPSGSPRSASHSRMFRARSSMRCSPAESPFSCASASRRWATRATFVISPLRSISTLWMYRLDQLSSSGGSLEKNPRLALLSPSSGGAPSATSQCRTLTLRPGAARFYLASPRPRRVSATATYRSGSEQSAAKLRRCGIGDLLACQRSPARTQGLRMRPAPPGWSCPAGSRPHPVDGALRTRLTEVSTWCDSSWADQRDGATTRAQLRPYRWWHPRQGRCAAGAGLLPAAVELPRCRAVSARRPEPSCERDRWPGAAGQEWRP